MKMQELFENIESRPLYHSDSGNRNKVIFWLSTDKDHSRLYGQNTKTYRIIGNPKTVDLGFRSAETVVPFKEILSRLTRNISRNILMRNRDEVLIYDKNSIKAVWEWMYDPLVLKIIKGDGVSVIIQREGMSSHSGNITTYGILDTKYIREIK